MMGLLSSRNEYRVYYCQQLCSSAKFSSFRSARAAHRHFRIEYDIVPAQEVGAGHVEGRRMP